MKRSHSTNEEPDRGMMGVRVAIVRDNEDPENLGRVKLEYPWRDADDESHWARIATNMTGDEYGTYFLPEVEDEVLVGFENGDIHNPVVLGALWSGNRKPPADNGDGENDIRTITTRSGHKIEFDDGDDAKVTIETEGGHTVLLDDDGDELLIEDNSGNSIEMDASSDKIAISAGQEISLDAPTVSIDAAQEFEASGGMVEITSDGIAEFTSTGPMDIDTGAVMGISATGALQIQGAIIQIN